MTKNESVGYGSMASLQQITGKLYNLRETIAGKTDENLHRQG